jgi:hypothetical protein
MTNLNILHVIATSPRTGFDWRVALVRLTLVAAPLALLIAIAHAL